jgi:hypothetical protein
MASAVSEPLRPVLESPKQGTAHSVGALELAIGRRRASVNRIIWIIGAIVVVLAILSFVGLR